MNRPFATTTAVSLPDVLEVEHTFSPGKITVAGSQFSAALWANATAIDTMWDFGGEVQPTAT